MLKVLIVNFLVVAVFCGYGQAANNGNAYCWNLKIYSGSNYTYTADTALKNTTTGQNLKVTAYFKKDLGNDNKFLCKAFSKRGKRLIHIGSLPGKGLCQALSSYGGTYWDEISKKLGVKNGCPIAAKTWYLNWYPLNYGDIPIMKIIPNGVYHIECYLTDLDNKVITGGLSFDTIKTN